MALSMRRKQQIAQQVAAEAEARELERLRAAMEQPPILESPCHITVRHAAHEYDHPQGRFYCPGVDPDAIACQQRSAHAAHKWPVWSDPHNRCPGKTRGW